MSALEQIGLNPDRDKILLAAFGDQRVITQALETGTIQGASLAGIFSRTFETRRLSISWATWKKFRWSAPASWSRSDYLGEASSRSRVTPSKKR